MTAPILYGLGVDTGEQYSPVMARLSGVFDSFSDSYVIETSNNWGMSWNPFMSGQLSGMTAFSVWKDWQQKQARVKLYNSDGESQWQYFDVPSNSFSQPSFLAINVFTVSNISDTTARVYITGYWSSMASFTVEIFDQNTSSWIFNNQTNLYNAWIDINRPTATPGQSTLFRISAQDMMMNSSGPYEFSVQNQPAQVISSSVSSGVQFDIDNVLISSQNVAFQYNSELIKNILGCQFTVAEESEDFFGVEMRSDKYPTLEVVPNDYLTDDYLEYPYLGESPVMGLMMGLQFKVQKIKNLGMQFFATIYNSNNIRILCEFPSRGLSSQNWTASSTQPGDFSVNNLNTDIVEQIWRSEQGTSSGISLVCDTGLPQGIFLDTLAILNHNMTKSANVTLLGSNSSNFSTIGASIPIQIREENAFYIAQDLPNFGYRYWKLLIDDATNQDGFVSIGSILFGSSKIFQGECFVDEIEFELKDYNDTVRTEGFTNVSNSRALKRKVRLEFRSLDSSLQNFKTMRSIFETYRTTHKCLWIPTPDPLDGDVTARFAVFGKLSAIPSERHNSKGPKADYVTFNIEVDESL